MNPWQAMEASRKAIHKLWWRFFGLYLAVGLLCFVAIIPLGIGLIWMLPASIVIAGVAYCCLFRDEIAS